MRDESCASATYVAAPRNWSRSSAGQCALRKRPRHVVDSRDALNSEAVCFLVQQKVGALEARGKQMKGSGRVATLPDLDKLQHEKVQFFFGLDLNWSNF